uniref:Transmembrane protein 104-like isoform X1 n=1 Tax=Castor canadensis TaxID=51338 RepID=A0A8B7U6V6_CASCN|nr:transmembrane protein 104-like isoform X1 [Castor canadensis]
MAGEITETGELYSPYVGMVYMFNLIVGTGALTMPKAFATAGWLVSLILLVFLGFMSFVTTTFVMEAMAAANAQLRWKRMETHKEEEDEDSSTASDNDILTQDNYEQAEKQPILSVQRRAFPNLFEITDRVEMGQMASMFFSKVGVNLFYFCIIIYLYGDLAIYAAAVPFSLMQVTCSATGNDSCGVEADTKYNDTDLCWGPLRRVDTYRIYLVSVECPAWNAPGQPEWC